jgi:Uncharacterized protein containing LysM domain
MWRVTLVAGVISHGPAAAAQAPELSVRRRGAARVAIEPGAMATLAFQIENRSSADRTIAPRVVLPADWRLVIGESPVTVRSGDAELRLVPIALPSHAAAGGYAVRYVIGASEDSVVVIVPARRQVTTLVREAPEFVKAGHAYDVVFAVRNAGNAPASVHLTISASAGISTGIDSDVVHLAAGREALVRARVHSDERIARGGSARVRLIAAVDGDTSRIEPAVSLVNLVAPHADGMSRFRRLPAQLTLRQVDRAARPTVELRGAGALTENGATQAQFLLRGLDQTASLFGEQDEYWLSIDAPRYRLHLGDRPAPYSRLGESWRPGFGAAGELRLGRVGLEAFAQGDRRTGTLARDVERGGRVSVRPSDQLLMDAGYLSRSGVSAADVWTTHGRLTPRHGPAVDAELAHGRDSVGGGGAYAIAVTGALPRGSYALRHLAADSGFPGLTRGTTSSEAAATILPGAGVSMAVSATDWAGRRPTMFASASSARQRALDGYVGWNGWIEMGYRWSTELRSMLPSSRERHAQGARLYVSVPTAAVTLRGGIEQGTSVFTDAPLERIPYRRLSAQASVGRGENTLGVSVESLVGTPVGSWMPDDHLRGALNAGMRLTPSTRLTTSVSATNYRGARTGTPMMIDVALTQSLPFGQTASWRTRAVSYGPGTPAVRPTHQADYLMPLGVPIGSSGATGSVHARLVDRETGRPMEGVLLRIGDRVRLTNADGSASFDGLSEATHYLEVEQAGIGPRRVVVPGPVLAVVVHRGETREIDLAAVRGASIDGQVRRFDAPSAAAPNSSSPIEAGTVPGTVLQIANGQDSLRTSVDETGQFHFGQIAPGRWVLSVVQADLPRYHRFEQDRMFLELAPGEAQHVELRASPSAPQVQMIARAELSLVPSSARPRSPGERTGVAVGESVAQWASRIRRVVPQPADGGVEDHGAVRMDGRDVPWETGTRRVVPPPARTVIAPEMAPAPPIVTKHRYTTTRWDVNLRQVARAMYGDSSLWAKIWLANLDQVRDPRAVRAGLRLRIPEQAPLTSEERQAAERYEAGAR